MSAGVDPTSSASNEKLVRDHLLRGMAAQGNFIGMKSAAAEPQAAAASSWSAIAELPRPFDFVLLGMGEDGHIASLFPDSPGLALALDPAQPPGCVGMLGPTAPRARLSLNLRALLDSRRIAVLIAGAAKWAVYEHARACVARWLICRCEHCCSSRMCRYRCTGRLRRGRNRASRARGSARRGRCRPAGRRCPAAPSAVFPRVRAWR